jgi:hypothetical protein
LARLAATRLLLLSTPLLLAFFFFLLAAQLLGPSGFFCAPALFCLRRFALSPFFRLGLCALLGQLLLAPASLSLLSPPLSLELLFLLLAAALLGPSGFFCLPALFRRCGFAPSPVFRLGFCAFLCELLFPATRFLFLAQPLFLVLLRFRLAAPLLGSSGFLRTPALFRFALALPLFILAALLGPLPLFRLRGFAPGTFFRLGLCAFLG